MASEFGVSFSPEVNTNTIILGAILAIVVWWIRGMPERKRANTDAEGKLRDDLFKSIAEINSQHRQCEQELRELRELYTGLQRQFIAYQLAVATAIPPTARSAEISAMIKSLSQLSEEGMEP